MISFTFVACILFASVLALEVPFYDVEEAEQLFEEFIIKHGKSYLNPQEKAKRLQIFKEKLHSINERNARSSSAMFAVTYYADLTAEEINNRLGFAPLGVDIDTNCTMIKNITTNDAPKSINWVKLGAVTSVKNQNMPRYCGSCYAFSTIGNIEGQYFIKNNKLQEFSVQEIVDCSTNTDGCDGGYMSNAINDLTRLGGVELNSTYPYVAQEQACKFKPANAVARIKGCTFYLPKNEELLKEVVAKRGPLSIAVSGYGLDDYHSGILTKQDCPPLSLGHAMLLVGYGTDEKGVDYWLVKNTYGPQWGEEGYVRFARGQNVCNFFNEFITSADLL